MDVGTLLFRDLDDICWSELEDPQSPYEMAGFTLPQGGETTEKTFMVSFIAARKANPFISRWLEIFLEVWKGVSESKGMHAHPLFKHAAWPRIAENIETQNSEADRHSTNIESHSEPKPQQSVPWGDHLDPQAQQDLVDYGAQFSCFNRLKILEDPFDGFSGSDYLANHALLFDGLQEAMLAHQLTGWNGQQQYQFLSTKMLHHEEGASPDQYYLDAERFAESIARDSCQMKVSHGIPSLGSPMLGRLWEQPGNEDADCADGTFAAYLRYASGNLEQTREMVAQRMEPSKGGRLRVGLLEVGNDEG